MVEQELPELGIDVRFLATGLGTYAFNVLKNLERSGLMRIRAVTRVEHTEILRPYCDSFRYVGAGMYTATEQLSLARAASGCRLFHATHYNVPVLHRGTILVTIHDLTHLLDKSLRKAFKSVFYAHPMLRFASSRASHLITVSEYSKRNLVHLLRVPEEKITVIPNGVDAAFQPENYESSLKAIQKLLRFDAPYVLFIGNLKPHKNVDGLLRAFAIMKNARQVDHKLLIVGEDSRHKPALVRLAVDLGLADNVIFAPRVAREYLRLLYCGAIVTVLPSFEEGFGLPVLESMACGTPVACSKTASLPEVGGDAAEYFDPTSAESIAQTICKLMNSSERLSELQRRGPERAKQFSWESSGREHLKLYRSLLQ